MDLSRYVYRCNDRLVNLTTKVTLPPDADEETLSQHYFLPGQERAALDHALFGSKTPSYLSMKVTPTWRCNLRCKHCFVLEKLTPKQKSRLDVGQVMTFVRNYHDRYRQTLKKIICCMVGGEVTMEVDKCLDLTEALMVYGEENGLEVRLGMTTNGTNLDLKVLELMNRCSTVTFSVDGVRDSHNWQRKAASGELIGQDLYERTVDNIRRVVKLGLREKVSVQAALMDQHCKPEMIREFYHEMIRAGVLAENIKVGAVSPTPTQPQVGERFKTYTGNHVAGSPCCKWRVGNEFIIDENNTIYCDYFDGTDGSALGQPSDPISGLLYNHERVVRESMPILDDPKCLECPVVGACWGRCCNVSKVHRPSEVCDQKGLIETVEREAATGNLFNLLRVTKGDCGGNS